MANKHETLTELLTAIAEKIRKKTGTAAAVVADNFPEALEAILTPADGSIPSQAGKTVTPSANEQTAVDSGVYTTGAVKVAGDANLKAENIAEGVSIFGVEGTHAGGGGTHKVRVVNVSDGAGCVEVFDEALDGFIPLEGEETEYVIDAIDVLRFRNTVHLLSPFEAKVCLKNGDDIWSNGGTAVKGAWSYVDLKFVVATGLSAQFSGSWDEVDSIEVYAEPD